LRSTYSVDNESIVLLLSFSPATDYTNTYDIEAFFKEMLEIAVPIMTNIQPFGQFIPASFQHHVRTDYSEDGKRVVNVAFTMKEEETLNKVTKDVEELIELSKVNETDLIKFWLSPAPSAPSEGSSHGTDQEPFIEAAGKIELQTSRRILQLIAVEAEKEDKVRQRGGFFFNFGRIIQSVEVFFRI